VEYAQSLVGVKVAVLPLQLTVPGTTVEPVLTVKVDEVMVAVFIGSLKITETAALIPTPAAPVEGLVEETVGGPASVGPPPLSPLLPPPPQVTNNSPRSKKIKVASVWRWKGDNRLFMIPPY
jgi:hypothetical protein